MPGGCCAMPTPESSPGALGGFCQLIISLSKLEEVSHMVQGRHEVAFGLFSAFSRKCLRSVQLYEGPGSQADVDKKKKIIIYFLPMTFLGMYTTSKRPDTFSCVFFIFAIFKTADRYVKHKMC